MWQTLESEDPDLVVLSPPCEAFCQMQNINFPRMGKVMAMQLKADGLHHMRVSMLIVAMEARQVVYV